MKKFIIIIICIILIIGAELIIYNNRSKEEKTADLTTIQLNEVTRSVFYAPQYVAISNGFFEEEGIKLEITTGQGADKVMTALLAGQSDIGLCGPEAAIYVYNEGKEEYVEVFAQLTQKDGSFLVSRKKYDNFTLEDLKGKTIIGGRIGGMPEMTFEWALKQNGIDPKNDLEIDTSIAFAAMGGAFIGGQGDFVTLFEPNALEIEQQGYGYVVASIGELGGVVPYTSYSARESYIKKNSELINNFTKAIQKGLDFVHNSSDKEVAEAILSQFPDTSLNDLEKVVARYRKIDAWPKTTKFSEESFNHLQDIMIDNGVLNNKVSYDKLIYNEK